MARVAKFLLIAAFCGGFVYLTSAAFVPSMGTGMWDFLFGGFAIVGFALGVFGAIRGYGRRDDERR
ncbi:MAG: hypothetical protein ACREVQ_13190 [Burkholderiales bacterium]